MYNVPCTADMLKNSHIPFALTITPFAKLHKEEVSYVLLAYILFLFIDPFSQQKKKRNFNSYKHLSSTEFIDLEKFINLSILNRY